MERALYNGSDHHRVNGFHCTDSLKVAAPTKPFLSAEPHQLLCLMSGDRSVFSRSSQSGRYADMKLLNALP